MGSCVPHVVVLGSGFGGLTSALALKALLGPDVEVTVVSPTERFVFSPWLLWLPFSERTADDVGFRIAPTLASHGVHVVHASASLIDPMNHTVTLTTGVTYGYDYLVVATGCADDRESVPGIGIGGHASTVTSLEEAVDAQRGWRHFLATPGSHLVVGAAPGAGWLGAAYELLFHASYQLKRHGLDRQVRLTYVTAEARLGSVGLGERPYGGQLLGTFARHTGIEVLTHTHIEAVDEHCLRLAGGTRMPFSWALVVPASRGHAVVAEAPGLADLQGLVPVGETFRSTAYDDVYAVGAAAAVCTPWTTAGEAFPVEAQARAAASDIAAQVGGRTALGGIPA